MNTNWRKIGAAVAAWMGRAACLLVLCGLTASAAKFPIPEGDLPLATKVTGAWVFDHPILWTGTEPPSDAQTKPLWEALMVLREQGEKEGLSALETYLVTAPDSLWAASLRCHLGHYYRQHGRYSLALNHWEAAWSMVKQDQTPNGLEIASRTLPYWCQLLASLGRVEQLKTIIAETSGRTLDGGPMDQLFNRTKEALRTMIANPGIAYRCGTFALRNVSAQLGKSRFGIMDFDLEPSPETGFSMAALSKLAQRFQLGLVPVKRLGNAPISIPSVVHWKLDHYAAIVGQNEGRYLVIDPTFQHGLWIREEVLNEEASGYFLMAESQITSDWQRLSDGETATIFGRGYANDIDDGSDGSGQPCDPENCPEDDPCCCPPPPPGSDGAGGGDPGGADPGAFGGGASGGGGGCCGSATSTVTTTVLGSGSAGGGGGAGGLNISGGGSPDDNGAANLLGDGTTGGPSTLGGQGGGGRGMPRWRVTEPFVNLWIDDEPIWYSPPRGQTIALRLSYKQREVVSPSPYLVNFGEMWNSTLLSWIKEDSGAGTATIRFPGGGERTYLTNANPAYDYVTGTQLKKVDSQTYEVKNSSGGKYVYSSWATFSPLSASYIFLTKMVDRVGNETTFTYTTYTNAGQIYLRLSTVLDAASSGLSLSYANSTNRAVVTSVTGLSGTANLQYDWQKRLSQITDAAGLPSTFSYNSSGWVTNMVTPYGTTSFKMYSLSGDDLIPGSVVIDDHPPGISRLVLATEPDGSRQLVFHRADSRVVSRTNSTELMPFYFADNEVPAAPEESLYFENRLPWPNDNTGSMHARNTYRWGRAQYAALSAGLRNSIDSALANVTNEWLYLDGLTLNDYLKAHLTHWLHQGVNSLPGVSPSMEREPGPSDGVEGQKTWYAYPGQISFHDGSTNNNVGNALAFRQPVYAGRRLSTNGPTHYFYYDRSTDGTTNAWGKALRIKEASLDNTGTLISARTNSYEYASNGFDLVKVTGPDGVVRDTYYYDNSYHQVTRHTNAVGVTSYTYHATTRQLTGIKRPNGLVITNSYDASGFLTNRVYYAVTGGGSLEKYYRTNNFTYLNGLVRTLTDEKNMTLTFFWDGLQRLTGVSFPDGSTTSNLYYLPGGATFPNSTGTTNILDATATKDRLDHWTYFGYDSLRRLTAWTNRLSVVTRYGYCECGGLTSVTNAFGTSLEQRWQHNYDVQGNRISTVLPDGSTTIWFRYNLQRRLTNTVFGNYSVTNILDSWERLVETRNAAGLTAGIGYDVYDRPVLVTNINNVIVTNTFDNADRLITRTPAGGQSEKWGYTTNILEFTSYTNQLGSNVVNRLFDALGRLTNEVAVGVTTNKFEYWPSSILFKLIDGKDQVTSWGHDAFGRITSKTNAANQEIFRFQYNRNNWVTNLWSKEKLNTIYAYDNLGRVTGVDYNSSPDLSMAYDALNRLTNAVVAGQATNKFTWTVNNQMASADGPWADDTITYAFNTNQLRSQLALQMPNASDWVEAYTYDTTRRLQSVASAAGTFTYSYKGVGILVTNLTLPNGSAITNAFDALARLTRTSLRSSSGTELNIHAYQYDSAHRRNRQDRTGGSYVEYTYDNDSQLIKARGKESGGTERLQEKFDYVYDGALNLARRTNNALVQTFTVTNLNQLSTASRSGTLTVAGTTRGTASSVTINGVAAVLYSDQSFATNGFSLSDGNNTFTAIAADSTGRNDTNSVTVYLPASPSYQYDGNGNLTSDGRRGFVYDDENQLASVTVTNDWKSEFSYDAFRRRIVRREYVWQGGAWVASAEVRYVYDGMLVVQERHFSPQLGTLLPQRTISYTRGRDLSGSMQGAGGIGGLLARTDHSQLNASQATAYYHADGNGNVTALADSQTVVARYLYDPFGNELGRSGPLADENVYRFSSKEFHAASGLSYYGFRYYEPNLQRWLNRDPIGERGGINLYGFVNGNPVNHIDIYGLVNWTGVGNSVSGTIANGLGIIGGAALAMGTGWSGVGGIVGVGLVGKSSYGMGANLANLWDALNDRDGRSKGSLPNDLAALCLPGSEDAQKAATALDLAADLAAGRVAAAAKTASLGTKYGMELLEGGATLGANFTPAAEQLINGLGGLSAVATLVSLGL